MRTLIRFLFVALAAFIALPLFAQKTTTQADVIKAKAEFHIKTRRITDIVIDTTFAAASDLKLPTQLAIKKYVDRRLAGRSLSTTAPTTGQVIKWDGSQWAPAADNGGSGGSVAIPLKRIPVGTGSGIGSSGNFVQDSFNIAFENGAFRIGRGRFSLGLNFAAGVGVLNNHSDQGGNIGIGDSCFAKLNGTRYNIGIGLNAFQNLEGPSAQFPGTTSNFNTGIGYNIARKSKRIFDFAGLGYGALEFVDSCAFTSALGYGIFSKPSRVVGMTGSGYGAGANLSTRADNGVLHGLSARRFGISSDEDVVFGYQALGGFLPGGSTPTGGANTTAVTSGNVIGGFEAAMDADTFRNSVVLGRRTLQRAQDINRMIAIGENISGVIDGFGTTIIGGGQIIPNDTYNEIYISNGGGGPTKLRNTGTQWQFEDPLLLKAYTSSSTITGTPIKALGTTSTGLVVPFDIPSGGASTVSTNSTLSGNGSIGTPLGIAQQSATTGQVLKWNGSTWAPAADAGGTVAEPLNQLLYGTTTGVTSSAGAKFTPRAGSVQGRMEVDGWLALSNSVNGELRIVKADNNDRLFTMDANYTSVYAPNNELAILVGQTAIDNRMYYRAGAHSIQAKNGANFAHFTSAGLAINNGTSVDAALSVKSQSTASADYAARFINSATTDLFAIKNNGAIGFGLTSPTALLHLKAGTTTLAPFKFTVGTDLLSPEPGAFEYNGTRLKITNNSSQRKELVFNDDIAGDLTGSYTNPQIATSAVGTSEIADGAITLAKMGAASVNSNAIVNGSIGALDIADQGAATGDVFRYSGAGGGWVPTTINGAVTGPANNLSLVDNAVTSNKIANNTILPADIFFASNSVGSTMYSDGTGWVFGQSRQESYNDISTGGGSGTVTLSGNRVDNILRGGNYTALTVTLPPTPSDGQLSSLTLDVSATSVTWDGSGNTVTGPLPSALAIGDAFNFKYYASTGKWHRVRY